MGEGLFAEQQGNFQAIFVVVNEYMHMLLL